LNAPVAGVIKDATIKGNPLVLRSILGYSSASRAAQGGEKAFMDATKFLVANMLRSMAKKLEIEMLYGQMGYGRISAVSGAVLTIRTSEWAPGIWAGSENMPIEIRSNDGLTSRGEAVIKSVDMDLRTLTLASAVPGVVVTVDSEDVIWHKGAYGNEFAGIHKIISITSGTLFGIDTSAYNLFKGNTYDAASAALSFNKLTNAAARAVEKGQDGELLCLVNNRAWSNLLNDQAALRMYDQSYSEKSMQNGAKSLTFHSQNGTLVIEPSIHVKEGYAYLVAVEDWYRIGSTDLTFKRPGQGDEFFRDLENSAGYELRCFSDQALFCSAPGHNVLVRNVVNAS